MKFNLKYLSLTSLIMLLPLMTTSMQNTDALFEIDYRKEGFGTIEDIENILLLKIGIDPHYEVAQDVMNRIYAGISELFVTQAKNLEVAVLNVDSTFVPGEIVVVNTPSRKPNNPEIKVVVTTAAKFLSYTFVETFSSLGNHEKQRVLYSICRPIQKRQLYFEDKEVTQSDLNRYIEWACGR